MLRIIKWAFVPVLAVALMAVDASQAQAGNGLRIQIGGVGGYGYSNFRSYRPSYGYSNYRSYDRGYNAYFGGRQHSFYGGNHGYRGHYDYHPPALVPHRGHLDYVPGHLHYHRGRHH